jgi:hypothetical protein
MLELMGGNRGQQRTSDCDEHDEGIILHEFGHFVMDRLSTNSSTGGTHPGGHLLDPGLAWEEGRATWLSAAVRREPTYQDTIGIEPQGSLRVDHAIERGDQGPRGVGAETSVSDILWDLTDGVDGYPDEDHDGVALGPAPLLRAMTEFADEPGAYPSLATFLRRITEAHGDRAPLLSRASSSSTSRTNCSRRAGADSRGMVRTCISCDRGARSMSTSSRSRGRKLS